LVDILLSETEDSNETLFYLQDIFNAGDEEINRMLTNALLHYAFLPSLVRSLCVISKKPLLSLNTCLYVLTQTFRIIKHKDLINALFLALFSPILPTKLKEEVDASPEFPASYR